MDTELNVLIPIIILITCFVINRKVKSVIVVADEFEKKIIIDKSFFITIIVSFLLNYTLMFILSFNFLKTTRIIFKYISIMTMMHYISIKERPHEIMGIYNISAIFEILLITSIFGVIGTEILQITSDIVVNITVLAMIIISIWGIIKLSIIKNEYLSGMK